MKTQVKFIIFIVAVIVLVGGFGVYSAFKPVPPSKLDSFAQCLKASGAEFYGAFWCPHCQDQKKEFGSAVKYLPYIECSNHDQTQTQICKDKKVESYPTWIFKDGSIVTGKMELTALRDKTQCVLPQQ